MAKETIMLTTEKYDSLLRCFSLFRDICNDIDIKKGKIRQRSNDNSCIFEVDLTPIIGEVSLPITYIKAKLDLFKIFGVDDTDIELSVTDKKFKIKDKYSVLEFVHPDLDYLDNKFISDDELKKLFDLKDENMLLTTSITNMITERMKVISNGFNVNVFNVAFTGESANITAESKSKDQNAVFIKDITTCRIVEGNTSLVVTPFLIDHDHALDFQMYETTPEIIINKYSCKVSDINVTIYSRSSLNK